MVNAIVINDQDTVATLTKKIMVGNDIVFVLDGKTITIKAILDIPMYHKIAIRETKKGDSILKYGEKIGFATKDILAGEHVHTHNMTSKL